MSREGFSTVVFRLLTKFLICKIYSGVSNDFPGQCSLLPGKVDDYCNDDTNLVIIMINIILYCCTVL